MKCLVALSVSCLVCLCACGEAKPSRSEVQEEPPANEAASGSFAHWKAHKQSDHDIQRKDYNPILHGAVRKQFDNLHAFADRFGEHYPDGTPIREAFYETFSNYHNLNTVDSEKWDPVYHANLTEWRDLNPEMAAPWIALANFEQHLAWAARGHGYADTVSEQAWKDFARHYERSGEILSEAPEVAQEDPEYYCAWISIGLGLGSPLEEVQKVFEAGQEVDPLYFSLYHSMVNFLLPRWYGERPDDWSKWLEEALKHPELSEEDRLVIYGRVVGRRVNASYGEFPSPAALYATLGVDRERFMKGLAAYTRRYPDSRDWPSLYLLHAWIANDKAAVADALKTMNGRYVPARFGGEEDFHKMLAFILESFPDLEALISGQAESSAEEAAEAGN